MPVRIVYHCGRNKDHRPGTKTCSVAAMQFAGTCVRLDRISREQQPMRIFGRLFGKKDKGEAAELVQPELEVLGIVDEVGLPDSANGDSNVGTVAPLKDRIGHVGGIESIT